MSNGIHQHPRRRCNYQSAFVSQVRGALSCAQSLWSYLLFVLQVLELEGGLCMSKEIDLKLLTNEVTDLENKVKD